MKKEVEKYGLEKIPKDEVMNVDGKLPRRSCQSYWRVAYGLSCFEYDEKKDMTSGIDFDQHWLKVKISITSVENVSFVVVFCTPAFISFSLPRGIADPERGFSINKHIIERHGPNIEEYK